MKKAVAIVGMVLSVLFLLAFIGGIAGVWVVRGQVLQFGADIAAVADQALQRGQASTARLTARVDQSQDRLANGVARIEAAGAKAEQPFAIMEELLDKDLAPAVDSLTELATGLRDTVALVDQAIALLQRLPFIGSEGRLLTNADALVERVKRLGERLQAGRAALASAKAGAIESAVETLTTPLAEVGDELQGLDEGLQQLTTRMAQIQARIPVALDRFRRVVTWTTVIMTVLLLWLALSQIVLFAYLYRLATGRDLLARKRNSADGADLAPL